MDRRTQIPGTQAIVLASSPSHLATGVSAFPIDCDRIRHDKFYKGGSQEKTHVLRPEFFLLPSPHDRARSVPGRRAMDSGCGHCDPAVWIFSTSGFHRLFATKPFSSETSKAERWSGA